MAFRWWEVARANRVRDYCCPEEAVAVDVEVHPLKHLVAAAEEGMIDEVGKKDGTIDEAEQAWLAEHPVVLLTPDADFPPIEFFDEQGQYRGIAADYAAIVE